MRRLLASLGNAGETINFSLSMSAGEHDLAATPNRYGWMKPDYGCQMNVMRSCLLASPLKLSNANTDRAAERSSGFEVVACSS